MSLQFKRECEWESISRTAWFLLFVKWQERVYGLGEFNGIRQGLLSRGRFKMACLKKKGFFLMASLFSVVLMGCGGRYRMQDYRSHIPNEMQSRIETMWEDAIWSVGTATGPDEHITISRATANARAELARQFRINVDVLEKAYDESVNEDHVGEYIEVKAIFATLEVSGSKRDMTLIRETDGGYSAKVLLVLSAEQFKSVLDNKLNAYTSFRSQSAYRELEERAERERRRLEELNR
ncbi:hypothetical protein CHISP_2797 [Chitinispirillum alkaliphilum]|nr:hypothetical protein CHISP_2797 [Chitinispirillum alkaliphilum]